MLIMLETGRRIGGWRRARDNDGHATGTGAIDGAVFGLIGLLIAFTFAGAAGRFDMRRQLILEEANAIGTAYLRLDLLPAADQRELKTLFRKYVDSRLAVYAVLPDVEAAKGKLAASATLQSEIWSRCVVSSSGAVANGPAVTTLVLSSLNEMIDITTARTVALQTHPPPVIFGMLGVMMLAGSMLAGYGMSSTQKRNWLHMMVFAVLMSSSIYVILDFEYPRGGLIRIDAVDQTLIDVRDAMK